MHEIGLFLRQRLQRAGDPGFAIERVEAVVGGGRLCRYEHGIGGVKFGASFFAHRIDATVASDREHPGRDRRLAPVKGRSLSPNGEHDLLRQFFGLGAVGADFDEVAFDLRREVAEQRREGSFVAVGGDCLDQGRQGFTV